jgi:hypothetical protein
MTVMGWTRVAPIQVFTWGRLYAEGALSAIGAGEDVVPARRFYPPANGIGSGRDPIDSGFGA